MLKMTGSPEVPASRRNNGDSEVVGFGVGGGGDGCDGSFNQKIV